ncbi:hypothetical protein, partial [Escherichia coli]|uniref:hypothetical protein n=1 Tax=Escherichia coli TaxID=562 RepID=UPI001B8CF7AC
MEKSKSHQTRRGFRSIVAKSLRCNDIDTSSGWNRSRALGSVTGRLYKQGDRPTMRPLIPLAFALLGATSLQASETVTVT